MICRLVFNLTCNCFQSKLFVVRTKIRMTGLSRAAWQAVWQAVRWCLPQQMWISKGEYELFFKVLIRHFLCSWQSAKTPGGGSFGHPRQEECLSHTHHPHCHSTALVFSLYTRRDIDSDDSYAYPLIHVCAQPIVWFERERKLRAGNTAETRQTW